MVVSELQPLPDKLVSCQETRNVVRVAPKVMSTVENFSRTVVVASDTYHVVGYLVDGYGDFLSKYIDILLFRRPKTHQELLFVILIVQSKCTCKISAVSRMRKIQDTD